MPGDFVADRRGVGEAGKPDGFLPAVFPHGDHQLTAQMATV